MMRKYGVYGEVHRLRVETHLGWGLQVLGDSRTRDTASVSSCLPF